MPPPMAAPAASGKPPLPLAVPPLPLAIIVAGPTCSGKSALAATLAKSLNGVVINADSMQVYRELRILTARPTPAEEATIPHRLYGIRPASLAGSVAWWRELCLAEMQQAHAAGAVPILCGGTGLYLAALTQGLTELPDPGPTARAEARALLQAIGPANLHARLAASDPATAANLRPTDSQRIARAWEILRGTGQGLAAWHQAPAQPPAPYNFKLLLLTPPRDHLRQAIADRFEIMIQVGAIDEVRDLLAQQLDPALPAMRAHGVPELADYLAGDIVLSEARRRICLATGQYTKRQTTWFKHHILTSPTRTVNIVTRIGQNQQLSKTQMADMHNFLTLSP